MHLRELRTQIHDYAERTAALLEQRRTRLGSLLAALREATDADVPQALGARFDAGESPADAFPFGDEPRRFVLVAADGSQILPDRHKTVVFAYVQAAAACIVYGCEDIPDAQRTAEEIQRDVRSRLLSELDLPVGESANPASEVSNLRDVLEIQLLADACTRFAALGVRPIVVADGSIVPFALLNERTLANAAQADKLLRPIVAALDTMRDANAIVVGYVDRPNSAGVAQTCALLSLPAATRTDDDAARAAAAGVEGIYDRHLFEQTLLPGHRSALFDPGWKVNEPRYLGVHAMRACCANFGDGLDARAVIARLEMPLWCASAENLAAATGVLRRHAALDPDGYPFILKAAHELAVVSRDAQREIEAALEQELLARGMRPRFSPKQAAKNRE